MVTIDAGGNPVEEGSSEMFKDAVTKITACQLDIFGSPTYPINEFGSKRTCKD